MIRITIPQAGFSELPVYLNGDIRQTYIRRGEGDYLVSEEELKMLIRNGSPKSNDRIPMKDLTIDDLDKPTLAMFRQLVGHAIPMVHTRI